MRVVFLRMDRNSPATSPPSPLRKRETAIRPCARIRARVCTISIVDNGTADSSKRPVSARLILDSSGRRGQGGRKKEKKNRKIQR